MPDYGANVSPCKTPATMSKNSVSPSGESIIITVTVSLMRQYARSVCFILPLSMESNALEKSTNICVASRFFYTYSFDELMDSLNLGGCGSISPKLFLTSGLIQVLFVCVAGQIQSTQSEIPRSSVIYV